MAAKGEFLDGMMANRFDPVAVGIPEERSIVGRVIVAQALIR